MSELRTDGALHWSIRESFLRYVSVIAHGTVETDGVETDANGRFVFPLRASRRTEDGWHLSFGGSVRFTAHNGFLDVLIAAPEVILERGGGVLATHIADSPDSLLALVDIEPADPATLDQATGWEAIPTRLRETAAEHFGNVYPGGTEMAPLGISVALIHS